MEEFNSISAMRNFLGQESSLTEDTLRVICLLLGPKTDK